MYWYVFVCHSYVLVSTRMYWYVQYPYVTRMYWYVSQCYSYVLVWCFSHDSFARHYAEYGKTVSITHTHGFCYWYNELRVGYRLTQFWEWSCAQFQNRLNAGHQADFEIFLPDYSLSGPPFDTVTITNWRVNDVGSSLQVYNWHGSCFPIRNRDNKRSLRDTTLWDLRGTVCSTMVQSSFKCAAVKDWNDPPKELRELSSVFSFKNKVL